MRNLNVVMAGVIGAAAIPTAAMASTAPAHGCAHLIVDKRGDAREWFLPGSPYNPDADLLSVDARTASGRLTFTARLAKVEAKPTTGTTVIIYFTTDHQGAQRDFQVAVDHEVDGDSFILQDNDTMAVVPVTGSIDTAAGTFTVHVPLSAIDSNYRGAVLDQLGLIVSQQVGTTLANGGFIEQSTGPDHDYITGNINNCRR